MPVVLGYWKLRGLCQPIRYLLEYTGTDWEDKYYNPGPPSNYTVEWDADKFNLGLPFPNLPYLIDGNVKLTQSKAILKYLARKHDLVGKTEEEIMRIDVIEGVAEDLRSGFTMLCYNPEFEKLKVDYLAALPAKLKLLSDYLADYDWFAGKKLTWVDFAVYETLSHHKVLAPEIIGQFEKLEKFLVRFEKLPKIAAYLSSPRFFKSPLNFVTAQFGEIKKISLQLIHKN